MKPNPRVLALAGAILVGLPLYAHHAISEVYDVARTVTIEGEVESFLFDNPHSVLHVRVHEPNGHVRTWAVEWRAADRLQRRGLGASALKRGDQVTLCGNPGLDPGTYRLYLLNAARVSPGNAGTESLDPTACDID